jgi:hypothetical protein
MASSKQSKHSFGPNELTDLDVAFDVAWAKLSGSVHDPKKVDAVKNTLRRQIVQVARAGITGSENISALALDYMPPLNASFAGPKARRHV